MIQNFLRGVKHLKILNLTIDTIEACKRNDRRAQEMVYRYFFPKILPFLRSFTNDEDEIISVFNDSMLRVFTKINSYSATGEFDAWVFRIVKNSLYNHYRLSYQKPDLSELQEQVNPENPVVLRKLYYEDLLRLLKLLPSQSSKVFRMYAIEGYSHKEIAARLGISVGTSKWHVFKAKEKLIGVIDFNAVRYG